MGKRLLTSAILLAVLIPIGIIGKIPYLCLSAFLVYVGGYEMLKAYRTEHPFLDKVKYYLPVLNVFILLVVYFSCFEVSDKPFDGNFNYGQILFAVAMGVLLLLSFFVFINGVTPGLLNILVFNFLYTGALFSFVLCTRYIGIEFLVWLLVLVFMSDTGAYVVGSLIGKHKICPKISPKKSLEGLIGGTVIGSGFGVLVYYLFLRSSLIDNIRQTVIVRMDGVLEAFMIVAVCLVVSLSSVIGDLVCSKIKRQTKIKDFGTLLPGHGGVLDRFDSVIFAGGVMLLFILGIFFV